MVSTFLRLRFYNAVIPQLTQTRSFAIIKFRCLSAGCGNNSLLASCLVSLVIEEVVDFAKQINLEGDVDDVQELLDSHNQQLTTDEPIEMYDQQQDVEELESVDPVQSKD
ncbi:hypothetical protein TNCV_739581 [Trichonephila clavipes]|nr:hypothetical protein TNCV_739581 [Trichonephila clavipes]